MVRIRPKTVKPREIYRADGNDLNIRTKNGKKIKRPHDVIIMSYNKRSKKAKVKVITSLTRKKKNRNEHQFNQSKLSDITYGNIIPIPKHEIGTHHLSGVHQTEKTIKISKLYQSTTGTFYPRRFHHIISKKK